MKTDKIAVLVKQVALKFDRESIPVFQKYNMTGSQYKILKYIYMQDSQMTTLKDLQQHFGMAHPTIIGILDNLEKNDFVRRIENPDDHRSHLIVLTEKAQNEGEELISIGDELENQLTKSLNREEKKTLAELLNRLLEETK